jgi:hypothetical protein
LVRCSSVDVDVPFLVGFSEVFSVWSDLIDEIRRNADWFDSEKWWPLDDFSSLVIGLFESIFQEI